ncbi:DUF5819 family protein [Streptomyces sp. SPB162]|uniref:DUF5819 family protein n=1 Tax=Streptomyces sp. SPB162 TaxID=2940560 RepID=UPI0024069F1F|nr:DUF5819 family protein [Streptomyces sp. SPB162]MDF9814447.1 hypothetical protein [Streptomyces sp. SPB162]
MEPPERPEPETGPDAGPGDAARPPVGAPGGAGAGHGPPSWAAAEDGTETGADADEVSGEPESAETWQLPSLSTGSWVVVSLAVAAVAVGVVFHLAMVFLHVAPSNTASKEYRSTVDTYVYPEFEQNWKLFAPDPLQQNIHVQARAQVRGPDGRLETTEWVDLTAIDLTGIQHTVAPSHTRQNELRRAWSFYTSAHGDNNTPSGVRGHLSQEYVQRIVESRFGPKLNGGDVVRVQARSATTSVAPPAWSDAKPSTGTQYQETLWWPVATPGQENAS